MPFTFLPYDFFYFWCLHNSCATECTLIKKISLARLFMCFFVWFIDISPLPHRVKWYEVFLFGRFLNMSSLPHIVPWFTVSLAWLFMWPFMWLLEHSDMDSFKYESSCRPLKGMDRPSVTDRWSELTNET